MSTPAVSVLMPCLNGAAHLAAAIASVQAQEVPDWELIIADDGSTDDSAKIAWACAAEDPRIRPLPVPDGGRTGAAATRNRALAQARGRYVAFLDCDDLWRPAKLARQLEAMAATGAPFCCSAYALHRPGRAPHVRDVPTRMDRAALLRGNRVGCLTAIYDRAALGPQPMPDIPMRHDYALWLHLLTLTPYVIGVNEVLADHHRRPGSLSAGVLRPTWATWTMLRHQAGLGRGKASQALAWHLTRRLWQR